MKNFGDDVDFETNVSLAQTNFTIFISDLHLCVSRPYITEAFLHFLKHTAVKADAFYILGDFFEYWAGDDDVEDIHHQKIIAALSMLAAAGVDIYFIHGNRDFLISADFGKAAKMTLLQDPTLINLYGRKVLLSHGDDLCTDDVAYQDFRHLVRQKKWQQDFLSQPLQARKSQIEAIRMRSEQEKSLKTSQIMDVNQQAVETSLVKFGYPSLFIHGHTHRPYEHHLELNGHNITRWVLGDWYEQGSYLVCDKNGCRSVGL
ncbi:MAG: UDP-2,3-diacylglucosamine diphosphatase [Methylotenera sp.]